MNLRKKLCFRCLKRQWCVAHLKVAIAYSTSNVVYRSTSPYIHLTVGVTAVLAIAVLDIAFGRYISTIDRNVRGGTGDAESLAVRADVVAFLYYEGLTLMYSNANDQQKVDQGFLPRIFLLARCKVLRRKPYGPSRRAVPSLQLSPFPPRSQSTISRPLLWVMAVCRGLGQR